MGSRSDRASRVETAADAVRAWIAERKLESGAKIPPERDLAEQLGVSRTVMREALSSLEALGLIERRATVGRFVAAGHPDRSQALVRAWLHQHRDEIYEVDEIRALVERHLVQALGAWDCARVAREAAEIIVRQEDALRRGDAFRAARLDCEFHQAICAHAENRMLRDLAWSLIEGKPSVGLAIYSLPDAAARSLSWHREIVQALERCDPRAAAELVFAHTQEAGRHLRDLESSDVALPSGSPASA